MDTVFDISDTAVFKRGLKDLNSSSVVIIGDDDYDWAPLIVANNLLATGKFAKIYWFRPGFKGLQIYKKVGALMQSFEDRLNESTVAVMKKVEVKSKDSKKTYKMFVVQPISQSRMEKLKRKRAKALEKRAKRTEQLLNNKKPTDKQ